MQPWKTFILNIDTNFLLVYDAKNIGCGSISTTILLNLNQCFVRCLVPNSLNRKLFNNYSLGLFLSYYRYCRHLLSSLHLLPGWVLLVQLTASLLLLRLQPLLKLCLCSSYIFAESILPIVYGFSKNYYCITLIDINIIRYIQDYIYTLR